jgi:hypothetical protein
LTLHLDLCKVVLKKNLAFAEAPWLIHKWQFV